MKIKSKKEIVLKKLSDLPTMVVSTGSIEINKTGGWRSVYPIINYDKCNSCMICWKYCPDACIEIKDGKPVIDLDYCKGCGICAEECPRKAIALVPEGK
jgi:2-oxoacid:acceptor oxidoreductase delta subunit (pyruvate/2-ketoisovalerate family)